MTTRTNSAVDEIYATALAHEEPRVKNWRPAVPLQSEPAECAIVCVALLSAMYGIPLCPSNIKSIFGLSTRGVVVSQIVTMFRIAGFGARALIIDASNKHGLGNGPLLALWRDNHFVVVGRRRRGGVDVFDPNIGWGFVTSSDLAEFMSGLAIEITKVPEVATLPLRHQIDLRAWLRPFGFFKKLRPVVVASFIAQALLLGLPLVTKDILDAAVSGNTNEAVVIGLVSFGAISLLGLISRSLSRRIASRISARLNPKLIHDVSSRLLAKPLAFLSRQIPAVLAGKLQTVRLVQSFMMQLFGSTIVNGILGLAALAMVAYLNMVFFILLITSVILGLFVDRYLVRSVSAAKERQYRASVVQHAGLEEMTRVAPALRAYKAIPAILEARLESSHKLAEASILFESTSQNRSDVQSTFDVLEQTVFLALGAWMISSEVLSVGSYVALGLYREFAKGGLTEIKEVFAQLIQLKTAAGRLEDIVEPITLAPSQESEVSLAGNRAYDIEVQDLSFAYSKFDTLIFRGVCLNVNIGECVAVVGPSGCGKSTLAKLLVGMLVPNEGCVYMGGLKVCEENEAELFRNVATVMQSDHLITGSIRENIDIYRGHSASEIHKAAEMADIAEFINGLPMKYETSISDEFAGLSGGQRQRVLIARALCGSPKVLLMDEATSFLDKDSERRIGKRIKNLKMTRIIFAHRDETIRTADRVVNMKDLIEPI